MPSETTHSPPDFHGGCGRREKQDEKLKCATHAFKHVFVHMLYCQTTVFRY